MNKSYEKIESDIAIFRDILESYIQPVTYGAIMSGPYTDAVRPLSPVVYDTQHRIKIFVSENSRVYFIFQRRLPFSAKEKKLIEDVIVGLRQMSGEDRAADCLHVQEVVERVVAFHISRDYGDLVFRLIQMYKEWAGKTGTEALSVHTTGIYFNRQKNTGCNIFTMFDDGLIRSIGSTDKTLLAIDRNGYIQSVENINSTAVQAKKQQNAFAPVSVADIAMWTDYRNKAVIRLTERGDILLFKDRKLVFARIFSQWRYFPHGTIMDEVFSEDITQEEKEVRKAVYLTLLDLIFDGKGARIGILDDPERQQKRLERIHSRFRFSPVLQAERNSFLTTILGTRKFHEIPRKIRAELCALDGVLLLGTQGDIFAGREAKKKHEARNLDKDNALLRPSGKNHDLGIRISELGCVEIYKNSDIPLAFA
ncbi:hypothetical protein NB640_02020 [Oxalobacter vibrioformis]|uniref:DAC domain-containing protein n=1 Tax=Oxalobacter vibrioformis TaxID=933080 RepID=A0A9E9LVF9_9BURK|nr:hypothetical protein [Oxalobacter vibrioformis]WAW10460.1 hypothetical protein NB640_02020 [Oxalobacter vibrioformis]